jgi:hypothetical protein
MKRAPRHILPLAALAAAAVLTAVAAPPSSALDGAFRIARLKYAGGGDWYSNPSSLPNLMKALGMRTSIPIATTEEARVDPLSEDLFNYPLVYMNGHGTVYFSPEVAQRLRTYLDSGGFLWADDNYGMDKSFREEIKKVFPDRQMIEVPFSNEIYHCFYDFPAGLPKIHKHDGKPPQGFGIFDGGRLVVFYTYETDIGDGLEDPDVHHDPPEKREAALRFAINLVNYVMTH